MSHFTTWEKPTHPGPFYGFTMEDYLITPPPNYKIPAEVGGTTRPVLIGYQQPYHSQQPGIYVTQWDGEPFSLRKDGTWSRYGDTFATDQEAFDALLACRFRDRYDRSREQDEISDRHDRARERYDLLSGRSSSGDRPGSPLGVPSAR